MLLPLMVVVLAIAHYVRLERQDDHASQWWEAPTI
jgi:hypothetical protein